MFGSPNGENLSLTVAFEGILSVVMSITTALLERVVYTSDITVIVP